jgi:ferredoxin-NADP reductase
MSNRDFRQEIEGYHDIAAEIAVLKKYAVERTGERGLGDRIIGRLHPKRLTLRVSEIRKETDSTITLRLVSADGYLPPFQAGQYINLFVKMGGIRTARPYSISSAPTQTAFYDITVRRVAEGFVSNYLLEDVKTGDCFESTSPEGYFYYNPLFHGKDLIFIAGGSGVTPFVSMIREVTDRGLDRRIHLIYGSRDPEDIIFREELEDRAARHKNLTFMPVISEPSPGYHGCTGFITAELIRKLAGETIGKMFYLCGPEAMYRFCLAELEKLGIPKKRIRQEPYGPPKDITAEPGWPTSLPGETAFHLTIRDGKTIAALAKEPIMISLERAGIVIPNACRSGECSLCRTKLLSGEVFQPQGAKVRKSDRRFGYIHACLAYPLTDLEIMI